LFATCGFIYIPCLLGNNESCGRTCVLTIIPIQWWRHHNFKSNVVHSVKLVGLRSFEWWYYVLLPRYSLVLGESTTQSSANTLSSRQAVAMGVLFLGCGGGGRALGMALVCGGDGQAQVVAHVYAGSDGRVVVVIGLIVVVVVDECGGGGRALVVALDEAGRRGRFVVGGGRAHGIAVAIVSSLMVVGGGGRALVIALGCVSGGRALVVVGCGRLLASWLIGGGSFGRVEDS
jgi:hypothetical protein